MSKRLAYSTRRRPILIALGIAALLILTALPLGAALRVQRPIADDGGRINQGYLWGEGDEEYGHRGVDFTYGLDTSVYAIASGTVVQVEEDYPDNNQDDSSG